MTAGVLWALVVIMELSGQDPARAEDATGRFMETAGRTAQPIGHYEFCKAYADECSKVSLNTSAAQVTASGWEIIRDINTRANRDVEPVADLENYGRDEVWIYPTSAGDCEDYVLLKRKRSFPGTFLDRGLCRMKVST